MNTHERALRFYADRADHSDEAQDRTCEWALEEINRIRAGLLTTAAECHRRKWAFDSPYSEAFRTLDDIGNGAKRLLGDPSVKGTEDQNNG